MGLFSKNTDEHAHEAPAQPTPPPQATAPADENPRRHNSIFHRNRDSRRDTSPTPTHGTSSSSGNSAPNSPEVTHSSSSTDGRSRNFLQRSGGNHNNNDIEMDPSIMRARERVLHAEASEREADRILAEARSAVNEARIEVKRIEEEAEEEARRAKIKAFHVKDISKRGNSLGRHFN